MLQPKLDKFKLLILDFDGVLVESVVLKQKIFAEVFYTLLERNLAIKAVNFSVKNDSLSRREKFEYALSLQALANTNLISVEILNARFQEIWEREKSKLYAVEGAAELLSYFSVKMKINICSAAPKSEILFLLKKFSWEPFIDKVYSTPNKSTTISQMLRILALEPSDVVFVGDSEQDEIAAQQNGIYFIPRVGSGTHYKTDLPSVQNMYQLLPFTMLK